MLSELFSQRTPVQSQHRGRGALVLLGVLHHRSKQRLLDLMKHHVVELATTLTIQGAKKVSNRFSGTFFEGWRPFMTL